MSNRVLQIEIASFWGGYQLCERSAAEKVGSGRTPWVKLQGSPARVFFNRGSWEGVERERSSVLEVQISKEMKLGIIPAMPIAYNMFVCSLFLYTFYASKNKMPGASHLSVR